MWKGLIFSGNRVTLLLDKSQKQDTSWIERRGGPGASRELHTGLCTLAYKLKVKSESEVTQSCLTLCDSMDCSLPGSSIHGIFQARLLEWVAMSFSRRSSWLRDWIQISRTVGRCFTVWATRELYRLMASKIISLETLLPGMFKHHLLGEPHLQTVWVVLSWVTSSPPSLPPPLLLC